MANEASGMRGDRTRNKDGTLRRKRSDTHVGTVETTYGKDFEVRSDMHLGTLLEQTERVSLHELVHDDSDAQSDRP
jgi:hypothetical protein